MNEQPSPVVQIDDGSDDIEFMQITWRLLKVLCKVAVWTAIISVGLSLLIELSPLWISVGVSGVTLAIWIGYHTYQMFEDRIPAIYKIILALFAGCVTGITLLIWIFGFIIKYGYWIMWGALIFTIVVTFISICHPGKAYKPPTEGGPQWGFGIGLIAVTIGVHFVPRIAEDQTAARKFVDNPPPTPPEK